ncbi:MAG: metallophosphoesterase family protein [Lachnospiraceae bacterium]|nr:metallophosphoesterase family protein [Lachnospiraceae bacterium]
MKIAVLSDIHGNHFALEKCIEEIKNRKIDKLIFLGDYLGELAYPQKTMNIINTLRQCYECYFVRGNKEDYWIEYENKKTIEWKDRDSTTGALLYTYNNLNKEDLSFFKSLSHMQIISFAGLPAIAAYHGSHDKEDNKLKLNTDNSHVFFDDTKESVILCGHTHVRNKVTNDGRILLNPGSVGAPLKSGGMSQFLILSGEHGKWEYEFVDLKYDAERAILELHEENLYVKAPCWTRITEQLLRHGEISHGEVLARAMRLLYNDTGKWSWPDIPENYWERAIEELSKTGGMRQ